MKKIVGILAAAAMAGSLFAVDMSAALKFNGSLFDMQFADGAKASALNLEQPKAQKGHGQTGIDLTVSADKAGATLILGNGYSGKNAVNYEGFKMWVQPTDSVKINLGELDYCLNKESIDYAGCLNGASGQGFGIDITPVDGLTLNVVLNPGYDSWLKAGVIGKTNVYAKYASDAGTFGVAYLATKPDFAENVVSASYSNNFSGVDMFADVAFVLADKLTNIKADAFVKGNADAFGYAAYVNFDMNKATDKTAFAAKAKFTYNMGSCTPYVYFKAMDFMADTIGMSIKPGVNFNIGAAGVEIAADINNIYDVGGTDTPMDTWKISVPFGISLNF